MPGKCTVVLSKAQAQCATFFWPDAPDLYVGYRFIEHRPEMSERPLDEMDRQPSRPSREPADPPQEPLAAERADPWSRGWSPSYAEADANNAIQLSFRSFADGSAWASGRDNGGEQERDFSFQPDANGVAMQMKLTARVAVLGACCVQQCLRFSGKTAVEWRRAVACVPSLSEFDVQAQGQPNQSLTFARQENRWLPFPVPYTKLPTRGGAALFGDAGAGEIDHGLIVRESLDRKHSAGMYWERTAYVSNRHPADCLHAAVDFGPLDPGASRTVHGKVYVIEGTKEDLLAQWREEFPVNNSAG